MNKIVPSEQINAAFEMGKFEARLRGNDASLRPSDFTSYLNSCEVADMIASTDVMLYLEENNFLGNTPLKNRYSKYKSKYWKSDIKFTKL